MKYKLTNFLGKATSRFSVSHNEVQHLTSSIQLVLLGNEYISLANPLPTVRRFESLSRV